MQNWTNPQDRSSTCCGDCIQLINNLVVLCACLKRWHPQTMSMLSLLVEGYGSTIARQIMRCKKVLVLSCTCTGTYAFTCTCTCTLYLASLYLVCVLLLHFDCTIYFTFYCTCSICVLHFCYKCAVPLLYFYL